MSCHKWVCREMLLFNAGILGHAFVIYFFTRLKTLNILLIQALLTCTMGRFLPGMSLLTKVRDIKNRLDVENLITETLPIPRKDWTKPANKSSSRKIMSLFPWLCTIHSNSLWLSANYQKKNFAFYQFLPSSCFLHTSLKTSSLTGSKMLSFL